MRNKRLGCLSGTGILAALITALVIAGYAFARGGLMYSPGPSEHAGRQNLRRRDLFMPRPGGIARRAMLRPGNPPRWQIAARSATPISRNRYAQSQPCTARCCTITRISVVAIATRSIVAQTAPLTEMKDATFPHEAVGFSLNGHQRTAAHNLFTCADCHHSDISTFAPDTCDSCHRQMDIQFMTAHTLSFGPACLDCHDGVDRLGKNFEHDKFSFKITGKHVGLACVQCHINSRRFGDFQATVQDCYSCHKKDEPHGGRFGLNSAGCHTADGWTPAKFDHNLAAFKLVGKHADVACKSCHANQQFRGTPADCYSCHKQNDEHNGQFGTDCAACHNPRVAG